MWWVNLINPFTTAMLQQILVDPTGEIWPVGSTSICCTHIAVVWG